MAYSQEFENKIIEEIQRLNGKIDNFNCVLTEKIEEVNTNLSKKIEDVNIDLHTMKNTNIAQILNQETKVQENIGKIKKEIESINNKLDHHIKQSIVDHKRFDCEIAKLQMQS